MKKFLISFAFAFCIVNSVMAQKIVYFSTVISNPDKTIDFDFGFYPSTAQYVESAAVSGYTMVRGAVINTTTAKPLEWKNYKIHVYLKSGKLIRNYTTKAESGDYAVNYTVGTGLTRYQEFCFNTKFRLEDIEKVWLAMGDNEIFELYRKETDKKTK